MEQRGRTYHRSRVARTFSEEIGAMLEGELTDPRIAPCYVSEVVLAPGGKSARIFIQVSGDEQAEADTLAGLMAARGYIKHSLLQRMGVRHVPDLSFQIDRSAKMETRMDALLGRVKKRNEKNAAKLATTEGSANPASKS
jgi:ribosome-binding factor A